MLGCAVTPASVQDRDQIAPLLKQVRRLFPFLERAIGDSGYQGATTAAAVKKAARLPLEIVKRSDTAKGFVVLPSAGSWSARSRGSAAAAALPRTSRT